MSTSTQTKATTDKLETQNDTLTPNATLHNYTVLPINYTDLNHRNKTNETDTESVTEGKLSFHLTERSPYSVALTEVEHGVQICLAETEIILVRGKGLKLDKLK